MNLDLKRFMIFNSSDGQDEGREQDKLLYHWTKNETNNRADLGEQIDDVCLCDASITTSERLGCGLMPAEKSNEQVASCSGIDSGETDVVKKYERSLVVYFDSTVIVIVEVEPETSVWMAVHVAHALVSEGEDLTATIQRHDPDTVPAEAIKQLVRNIYDRFCLINGTFQMIAQEVGVSRSEGACRDKSVLRDKIRTICDMYFNSVLSAIHLSSVVSNIAPLYNYLVYLDLNSDTLMKIISFINHVVSVDAAQLRHTIAIFNDHLLWSSLNAYDSRQVFNYLITVLVRKALQEELSKEVDKVRRIAEDAPLFLTDNPEADSSVDSTFSTLSIAHHKEPKRFYKHFMTVFRSSNNLTLGLIFKMSKQVDLIQKCEQILTSDTRLGVIPLASLAKSVGQNYLRTSQVPGLLLSSASPQSGSNSSNRRKYIPTSSQKTSSLTDQRFIYLDHLSCSTTNSFGLDAQSRDTHSLPENIGPEALGNRKLRLVKCVLDLEPELRYIENQANARVSEYLAKTTNDNWITVMNSKYRCLYSIYKMRNAGLNEARQSAINLQIKLINDQESCA